MVTKKRQQNQFIVTLRQFWSDETNLRLRVLLPLSLGFIIFLLLSLYGTFWLLRHETASEVKRQSRNVERILQQNYANAYAHMRYEGKLLAEDSGIVEFWLAQDFISLKSRIAPFFEELTEIQQISHLSLLDPAGRVLFRFHVPEISGDSLLTPSELTALRSHGYFEGIKFGINGRPRIFSITPCYNQGELIGFVSIAKDLQSIIEHVALSHELQEVLLVNKSFTTKGGNELESSETELPPLNIHAIQTMSFVDSTGRITRWLLEREQDRLFEGQLTTPEGTFAVTGTALVSFDGQPIGQLLLFSDISGYVELKKKILILIFVLSAVGMTIMFFLTKKMLQSAENEIRRSQMQILEESFQREEAQEQHLSKLKRAETSLIEQNKFMQRLIDGIPNPVYYKGTDGRYIGVNEAYLKLFDMKEDEVIGKGASEIFEPALAERIDDIDGRVMRESSTFTEEMELVTRSDERKTLIVSKAPFFNLAGEPAGVIGVDLDITERKKAQEALQESDRRFQLVADAAPVVIWQTDAEGKTIYVNNAWSLFTGLTIEEGLDNGWMNLIHPDDTTAVMEGFRENMSHPKEFSSEYRFRDAKGAYRWYAVRGVPIIQNDGTFNGYVGTTVDIHDRKMAVVALMENERHFRTVADSAPVFIWVADINKTFTYFNKSWLNFRGRELDQEIDFGWIEGVHPEDFTRFNETFDNAYRRKIEFLIEFRVRDASERYCWILNKGVPVFREDGSFNGFMGSCVDVTESKQALLKLEQLAAFPHNSPEITISLNARGEVVYFNPAAQETLKKMKLPPTEFTKILPKEMKLIAFTVLNKRSGTTGLEVNYNDRSWRWDFYPVPQQEIIHGYAADITDFLRHENELRKLSAAVTQSASMICITSPEGIIEFVNPRFVEVTGYSFTEAIGQSSSLLKSGHHEKEFFAQIWQTITMGKSWLGQIKNRRKDGKTYWERKSISPIFDNDGRISHFLSIGEDITLELERNQKVMEADKLSAVGVLAAGVAHEFKNYLGGIIGNASFTLSELEQSDGPDIAKETLQRIIEMGEKANEVAMSLLSYSKAKPEDTRKENIKASILKAINLVEKEMKNQNINIVTHFEETPELELSASKIQQLMLNLFINAQHAIGSNGVITVAVLNVGDRVEVKVGDTGVGIPAENIGKIFDPFFSTKGVWGKDDVVGTGMGLAICRNIAREHGGDLSVDSRKGIGTTFTLTLPVGSDTAPTAATATAIDFRIMIFSLNNKILEKYYPEACQRRVDLFAVDNIGLVSGDLTEVTEFVIFDARFSGKVELYRMVEKAIAANIPYVMINCGTMEYQLAELYEKSKANFKESPDFQKILAIAASEARTRDKVPTT